MTSTYEKFLADLPANMIAKVSELSTLGRRTMIDEEVELLRPLFAKYDTNEDAVIALHAVFLHKAAMISCPDDFAVPAAVLFGLGRALRPECRVVPADVVLNVLAHTIRAALAAADARDTVDARRHLELARSWMAHAYLVAGVESGGAR
ncbi:hypothetical protein LCL61_08740 [Amycolatopsis coloradensis]|uniref:Uncharacterized protein n=1 Tax=Amycolatopsis coloradensis TaxID=76021 RepID=A0ACD5B8D5_9PSEU